MPRKSRRQQPRRSSLLWGALLSLGLFAIISSGLLLQQYLSAPGRLPIRVIQISGEFTHLQRSQIERVVAAAIDGGFFTVDMHRVRDAVLQMPWVQEVSVRRVWPDTLHMPVVEQLPLARWGNRALVNVAGDIFRPDSLNMAKDLVRLYGPVGSTQRVVAFYQHLLPQARKRQLQVARVLLDKRRHWTVGFDNGLKLVLGHRAIEQRLNDFIKLYPRLTTMPEGKPERVDMRYAHGFAVKWKKQPGERANDQRPKPRGDV